MTELRQRDPRQEDAKHLAFVRTQPCCLPFCKREAEPAHLRMENLAIGKELTGKGEKPHDRYTVPLCPYHHRLGVDCQHNSNEREWWEMRGINPWAIAASLWIASGGAERAAMPVKAKRVRPIKERKPRELRAKMSGGKPLKSRGFDIQHRPMRWGTAHSGANQSPHHNALGESS